MLYKSILLIILGVIAIESAASVLHWSFGNALSHDLLRPVDAPPQNEDNANPQNVTVVKLGLTPDQAAADVEFILYDNGDCTGSSYTEEASGPSGATWCTDVSTTFNDLTSCFYISDGLSCTMFEDANCAGQSFAAPSGTCDNGISSVSCVIQCISVAVSLMRQISGASPTS
ncbi:uncharacterized protein STEHIDRAFT_109697 [Stereum hirsutum FP-91666 SS1]|uniref:uncharacterized protein n=1 Tax=Stereum hirsutum (strain FP-91666) TaxID=721885 RepID=UPI0004409EA6|nr:uncharacterized protein STEHIDRAFT_109697 [Stereum hirsutum FP-91666 SS1]EIM87819.1 hypothetical protein STEHIDRAFT_109697 [Stereum hirsutum FP-91666 SS1]